nr:uncharacterized protein LOC113741433 [Coffea arabica]
MQAELRALLWGVRHCVIQGYLELHLEADSLTLVQIVQGTSECPWRLQRDLDELMIFKQSFQSITHCYREANTPADHLANFGADACAGHVFNTISDLPQLVRGAIRLDRLGLPTFRTRWNKEVFGNIFDRVRDHEAKVSELECSLEEGPSEEGTYQLVQAQGELKQSLLTEAAFWRQKACLRWLREGDANSKFFHAQVKQRRARSCIHRVKDGDGVWTEEAGRIEDLAVAFFEGVLSQPDRGQVDPSQLSVIPSIITAQDNVSLQQFPTEEEIRSVVFQMDGESSSGPDGFKGSFFTTCWEIVKGDIVRAVCDFFAGAELPWGYTSTWLALIPKVPGAASFSDFRPISLCNFVNKIISKLLASRLESVLPKIISPQQSGFVKGRQISDNILLALEMCSALGKKVRGSNVALKLDMAKAYDRVSWNFLIQVMRRFGFGEQWLDMVWRLISSCHFSVLVNGKPCGYFQSSRGFFYPRGPFIPLSPALFIIAAEVLSRRLNELPRASRFVPFLVSRGSPPLTHLAYADDIIVFCNGGKRSLEFVREVLQGYQEVSGQLVNVAKSCFLVGKKTSVARRRIIAHVTGFCSRSLPVTYLGCPLFEGRRVKALFSNLLSKVSQRIASWHGRWLSMSARAILIKHVLSSMPIHILAVIEPPKGVISDLERILARFFWGESEFGAKRHWSKWANLCFPVEEGGVGFRSLQTIVEAFSCKLWWMFRHGQSLWAQFMRARYFGPLHPNQGPFSVQLSATCKRMLSVRTTMELWLQWDLSREEVAFWWDNWSGLGPLAWRFPEAASDVKVLDFVREGRWDFSALASVPAAIWDAAQGSFFCFGLDPDTLVWRRDPSGVFSTRSAYQLARPARARSWTFSFVWHSFIPRKLSFFMWRLQNGQLPLDDVLEKYHIHGPSKYHCCVLGQVETMEHVFSAGQLASATWVFFENSLGLSTSAATVRSRCAAWWLRPVKGKALRWLMRILPILILWFLWRARNLSRFEGRKFSVSQVRAFIIQEVRMLVRAHFLGIMVPWQWEELLQALSGVRRVLTATIVRWAFPPTGCYKLNTDGCATAEARALLLGLQLGRQVGVPQLIVESDCLALIKCLRKEWGVPAGIRPIVRAIWMGESSSHCFFHCYREGNTVADSLAAYGALSGAQNECWSNKEMHAKVAENSSDREKTLLFCSSTSEESMKND